MKRTTLAATIVGILCLAGCGDDAVSSAREAAQVIGCSDIRVADVPPAWAKYDQAVTCTLDAATIAVYWSPPDGFAVDCIEGSSEACNAALKTSREKWSSALPR